MPKKQNCKTCKHWEQDRAKDVAGRILSDRPAPCLYPMPSLPDSFRPNHLITNFATAELRWMAAFDGRECPTYCVNQ